jgi:Helix-turn-helix domain
VPIPVPPWVHRVMIREHGPANSTMKLCLFTVNAFLHDDGTCFPSQIAIKNAAALGESTVQRTLAQAIDLGWLGVQIRNKSKGWANYVYRAAVPDALRECDTMLNHKIASLVEKHIEKYGPLATGGRLVKKQRARNGVTGLVPSLRRNAPLADDNMVPSLDSLVPPQRGTKFLSEVPKEKLVNEGPVTGDRMTRVESSNPKETADLEMKAATEARARRVRIALASFPDSGDADIVKMTLVPLEEVQQIRRQA